MDAMIAYCGLNCAQCPALLATQQDDDNERKKVAEQWSKQYSSEIKPEDINCLGCLSEKRPVFHYCTICEIRKCGRERGVINCAHCDDYACEKLNNFFSMAPEAKNSLEEIRKNL